MNEKESRFDDRPLATPPPSPFRASNTLESLKPRDISWPLATLPGPSYAGASADVPPELDFVRKTDNPSTNVLPVNWPASSNKPPKPVLLPSVYDRVTKLEEQVDSLLDRLAKFSIRSSHKI